MSAVFVKLISSLLNPLVLILFILALILFFSKVKPIKKIIFSLLLCIYLLCLKPVSFLLLMPLEKYSHYLEGTRKFAQEKASAIVLLGGGLNFHGSWSEATLSLDSLSRTIKAAAIYNKLENKIPIIASGLGYRKKGESSESLVMKKKLEELKITDVLMEDKSLNTFENAAKTKEFLIEQGLWHDRYPIILVTSSMHLPRASACFERQGFLVYPQASHFIGSSDVNIEWSSFVPRTQAFQHINQALHEYFGYVFYKFRGKI